MVTSKKKSKKPLVKRLKRFFTEKPEGNIWKRTTIYLILFRFLGIWMIIFSVPLLVGLLTPEQDMDFTEISENLANSFVLVMEKLYDAGSRIAVSNPIISKVLVFAFANVIWVYWVGLAYLFVDIIRHLTSWLINKNKDENKRPH